MEVCNPIGIPRLLGIGGQSTWPCKQSFLILLKKSIFIYFIHLFICAYIVRAVSSLDVTTFFFFTQVANWNASGRVGVVTGKYWIYSNSENENNFKIWTLLLVPDDLQLLVTLVTMDINVWLWNWESLQHAMFTSKYFLLLWTRVFGGDFWLLQINGPWGPTDVFIFIVSIK
jgi:hypothetical protein